MLVKTEKDAKFWKLTTVVGLFIGYSGYYICRSNLAIASPLIIKEFADQGINKEVIGQIASIGVMFYAIGKVLNGVLGDFVGGKKIFILGMIGSVVATIVFGLGTGITIFLVSWIANRLIQSMGWGGLVKVTANWFSFRQYGMIMGFLSLSFLVGDIVARIVLGQMLNWDFSWREIFFVSAILLLLLAIFNIFLVKDKPEDLGLTAAEVHPKNLFHHSDQTSPPENLKKLLLPYFKSIPFILMLIMSFGLTAIREAFNFWIPTYLYEASGYKEGVAAQLSALYPVFGIISILATGYLSDKYLKSKRGIIILIACIPIAIVLFFMTISFRNQMMPLILISLVGLLLLGPYSFLAGAMSLDAGGKKGAATAAGLVDATGYAGGTMAVWMTGLLAENYGWNWSFVLLACIAGLTSIAALIYFMIQETETLPRKKI